MTAARSGFGAPWKVSKKEGGQVSTIFLDRLNLSASSRFLMISESAYQPLKGTPVYFKPPISKAMFDTMGIPYHLRPRSLNCSLSLSLSLTSGITALGKNLTRGSTSGLTYTTAGNIVNMSWSANSSFVCSGKFFWSIFVKSASIGSPMTSPVLAFLNPAYLMTCLFQILGPSFVPTV